MGSPSRRKQGVYIDLRDIDFVLDREDQGAPVAPPLAVIGLHDGTEVSALGGRDHGSIGTDSFDTLVATEEKEVGHHGGGRYVLYDCKWRLFDIEIVFLTMTSAVLLGCRFVGVVDFI